MKTFLIFLLGAALGIASYIFYQRSHHPTMSQRTNAAVDTTKEKAVEVKDAVVEESKKVGGTMDDTRITAAIKGKYILDRDLSVLAISVSCTKGHVLLRGTVASVDLAARASRFARETGGVVAVDSELVVKN